MPTSSPRAELGAAIARPHVYAALMQAGRADVFITYRTNAVAALADAPALRRVDVPEAANVHALYGVTLLSGAGVDAQRFVQFLLGPAGQTVLSRHGFAAP
jgi:ABC-type molybdate transport system substrate-binding protein